MTGMHHTTGLAVEGIEHLYQSIADILTTPIGSRVLRREYGSLLFELIDQPDNGAVRLRMFGAVATALMRWERRIKLSRLGITRTAIPGQVALDIEGTYIPDDGNARALSATIPIQLLGSAGV